MAAYMIHRICKLKNDALFEYVKRGGYCEVNDGYEFDYNRIR